MSEPTDFIDFDDFDPDDVERREAALKKSDAVADQQVRDVLELRKRYYGEVFSKGHTSQEAIDFVLNDLGWFCRAHSSTYSPNDGPNATDLMKIKEGRREAFMRIRDYASLSLDALFLKYTDASLK